MVKLIPQELIDQARNGKFLHCKHIHDHTCEYEGIEKFCRVIVRAWKMYLPVHALPILIFKFKQLRKTPGKVLKRLVKDTVYSCLWLATYIACYRYFFCLFKNVSFLLVNVFRCWAELIGCRLDWLDSSVDLDCFGSIKIGR